MHDVVIVGIPLFVILAGILLNRADFRRLEDRMDRRFETSRSDMDRRFETLRSDMDSRFETVRSDMDSRFETVRSDMDRRFETLRSEMNARFDLVDTELRYFHKQEGRHETRLDQLEKK